MSAAAGSSSRTRSTRSASPSPAARRSTSAHPPAASPTCCSSAAPRAWSRSTSGTASSTGAFATIRASSSSSAPTHDRWRPATFRRSSTSSPSTCRSSRCATSFRAYRPLLARRRRRRGARQTAVRGGTRRGRQERRRPRSQVQARVVDEATRAAAEVGLVARSHDGISDHGRHGQPRVLPASRGSASRRPRDSMMRAVGIVAKARSRARGRPPRADRVVAGGAARHGDLRSRHSGAGQVCRRAPRPARDIVDRDELPRHVGHDRGPRGRRHAARHGRTHRQSAGPISRSSASTSAASDSSPK